MNNNIETVKQLLTTAQTLLEQATAMLANLNNNYRVMPLFQRSLTSSAIAAHYHNMTAATLNIDLQQAGILTRHANDDKQWYLTDAYATGNYVEYRTRTRNDGTMYQLLYWTPDGQRLIVKTLQQQFGLIPDATADDSLATPANVNQPATNAAMPADYLTPPSNNGFNNQANSMMTNHQPLSTNEAADFVKRTMSQLNNDNQSQRLF